MSTKVAEEPLVRGQITHSGGVDAKQPTTQVIQRKAQGFHLLAGTRDRNDHGCQLLTGAMMRILTKRRWFYGDTKGLYAVKCERNVDSPFAS